MNTPAKTILLRFWFPGWVVLLLAWGASAGQSRKTISLDGQWQIGEGHMDAPPAQFASRVPVPGLVDMATPSFFEPGPKVAERGQTAQKDPRRDAFWYRRTFKITGPIPEVATIKVGKAMFGTRVILNGQLLGDHLPCFTPGLFDAKMALKVGENELLVRVGAARDAVTTAVPSGFDFEKERYLPGIFDSVELILCGRPHIANLQVAPDLARHQARVRLWLEGATVGEVKIEVREAKSGRLAGKISARMTAAPEQGLDLAVPVSDPHLWSPEDPFLYELTARTSGDEFKTRFGMREFRFDPATGRAILNGKPYFMRGSNITLYRFFEDSARGNLPWTEAWVRLLHQRVKGMHWNCLRYCIGFPPELWYRIADEQGILIDDEFPIWHGGDVPKALPTEELVKEYAEWMHERWNHPCVVIWDACNETLSPKTGAAFKQIRALDLSNRPWDDGYSPPQEPGDMSESHPYHFSNPNYKLEQLANANPDPHGGKSPNAVVINEYGWLWLNRDGSPTTLTRDLYRNLLGENSTVEQRRHLYATYTAAETEFWRHGRHAAAVMHFTTLGYSRSDGQTSDHWLDVKKLEWDPEFVKYVSDAFSPVGVMINAWAEEYTPGQHHEFPVSVINDLYDDWKGTVRFRLERDGSVLQEKTEPCEVLALGNKKLSFTVDIPGQRGRYLLEAALLKRGAAPVRSRREFSLVTEAEKKAREGLAFGKPVSASSNVTRAGATLPEAAVDGRTDTRWSSEFSDDQWLAVDLGTNETVACVVLLWEAAHARSYAIEVSNDGKEWKEVFTTTDGKGGAEQCRFAPVLARWVRFHGHQRATQFGYSLWEMRVFGQ